MDGSGLEQAVRGELELLRSDVRSDVGRLEALLDEDFVEIGASGRVWTRTAVIADLLAAPPVDVEVADMSARQIDARVVLVTYTTVSRDRRVLRTSWWRNTGGAWRCCFHQGTIAAATAPPRPDRDGAEASAG